MRIGVLLLIVLLAGCATPDDLAPAAQPTDEATIEATVEDDYAACAMMADLMLPVQEIVTGIAEDPTGGTLSEANVSDVARSLRELLEMTTPQMDAYAAPFSSIVLTLDDLFEGRLSGSQNLDGDAYRNAVIGVLGYCVDEVGYSANG